MRRNEDGADGGFLLMERREEEVRRRRDRSSVGQTESWRAEDKRGEGDRGCVCVFGGWDKKQMG